MCASSFLFPLFLFSSIDHSRFQWFLRASGNVVTAPIGVLTQAWYPYVFAVKTPAVLIPCSWRHWAVLDWRKLMAHCDLHHDTIRRPLNVTIGLAIDDDPKFVRFSSRRPLPLGNSALQRLIMTALHTDTSSLGDVTLMLRVIGCDLSKDLEPSVCFFPLRFLNEVKTKRAYSELHCFCSLLIVLWFAFPYHISWELCTFWYHILQSSQIMAVLESTFIVIIFLLIYVDTIRSFKLLSITMLRIIYVLNYFHNYDFVLTDPTYALGFPANDGMICWWKPV